MTYAHLKIEGKDWLVPETSFGRADYWNVDTEGEHKETENAYLYYIETKQGWLEIQPDHVKEFEGRKGLAEGKDFEVDSTTMDDGVNVHEFEKQFAIPMTQTQTTEERADEFYPGSEYQRLFNAISDSSGIPLESEMDAIIKIVHEDFPAMLEFARTGEKEVEPEGEQPERVGTASGFINRAIGMLKEQYQDEWLVAGYNGIVALLGYAKQKIERMDEQLQSLTAEVKRLKEQQGEAVETLLKKYRAFISNIEWHIETNKPVGKDLELCKDKLDNYVQIESDITQLFTKSKSTQ